MRSEFPASFISMPVFCDEHVFGDGKLKGKVLRRDGDWRTYIPSFEAQSNAAFESSSCVT